MKKLLIIALLFLCFVSQVKAQSIREFTANATCVGSENKSTSFDYSLGYSYREYDSTLIISGSLGQENCGIEHHFTARVDSNKVELSEIIVDTLVATCSCLHQIELEIDSFYYEEFTVEFDGYFLAGIPRERISENVRVYPNPTAGKIKLDLLDISIPVEVSILDISGRVVESMETSGQRLLEIDLGKYKAGVYLVKINQLNFNKIVIRN